MSEPKTYPVKSLDGVEPVVFVLGDETFRVPRKQHNGVLLYLARNAVMLESDGRTHYDRQTLIGAISSLLADELWDFGAQQWVPTDDRVRLHAMLDGSRVEIETETLSEIVSDVLEELSGHPTGAPNS